MQLLALKMGHAAQQSLRGLRFTLSRPLHSSPPLGPSLTPKCHYTLPHVILRSKQRDEVSSLNKQRFSPFVSPVSRQPQAGKIPPSPHGIAARNYPVPGCISDFLPSYSGFCFRFTPVARRGVFAIIMAHRRFGEYRGHGTLPGGTDRSSILNCGIPFERSSLCASATKHFAHSSGL